MIEGEKKILEIALQQDKPRVLKLVTDPYIYIRGWMGMEKGIMIEITTVFGVYITQTCKLILVDISSKVVGASISSIEKARTVYSEVVPRLSQWLSSIRLYQQSSTRSFTS